MPTRRGEKQPGEFSRAENKPMKKGAGPHLHTLKRDDQGERQKIWGQLRMEADLTLPVAPTEVRKTLTMDSEVNQAGSKHLGTETEELCEEGHQTPGRGQGQGWPPGSPLSGWLSGGCPPNLGVPKNKTRL